MGKADLLLGAQIEHKDDKVVFHQERYCNDVVKKFEKQLIDGAVYRIKARDSPMPSVKLAKDVGTRLSPKGHKMYQQITGHLIYAGFTRPDIATQVSSCAKYMSCPTDVHLQAAYDILGYLKAKPGLGLTYRKDPTDNTPLTVFGYCDSGFASDTDTRKSSGGECFFTNTGFLSHRVKNHPIVALSSAEAELIQLCSSVKQALFIRNLMNEIGFTQLEPTMMNEDNQAAIFLANNKACNDRTKHIHMRYLMVRDTIADKFIKVQHCPTECMLADVFTKPLTIKTFKGLMSMIMDPISHNVHKYGTGQWKFPRTPK